MARKAVRRLEIEQVTREVWQADGLPTGLVIRVLNVDEETGARTMIVDVPPRWEHAMPRWHGCDEEFLVLEGELEIGASRYREGRYVFRPAGLVHGPTRSSGGCRLLYWHESAFDVRPGSAGAAPSGKPFIDGRDTTVPKEQWERFPVPLPTPALMIRLRTQEETGCDTTLEWIPPNTMSPAREYHTADEEIYIMDGWAATDPKHVYLPGSYLFWEAKTVHGPVQAWDLTCIVKHYGVQETVHVEEERG